jgi:hypothetical protein
MGEEKRMKAITLTEPFGTLIAIGAKALETRSWPTRYRGPIAIHAAKSLPSWAADLIRYFDADVWDAFKRASISPYSGLPTHEPFIDPLDWSEPGVPISRLMTATRGHLIATAELIGCYKTEFVTTHCSISYQERAFGDYTPGRFAFRLANVVRLPEPIPATGALGLWDLADALLMDRSAAA